MIRVLLVDDHAVVRVGFKLLLQTATDMEVIGEADSGEAAFEKLSDDSPDAFPDVIVMDISMPGIGGLEALRRIKQRNPTVRILALSAHDDVMHAQRAMRQGAVGFLSKRSAPETLLEAVRAVSSGKRYIDAKLADDLALSGVEVEGASLVDRLSEREFEVFLRLAKGATVEKIAKDLSVSSSTVGTHLYNVKQKLGAVNQSELTLLALRAGLIEA